MAVRGRSKANGVTTVPKRIGGEIQTQDSHNNNVNSPLVGPTHCPHVQAWKEEKGERLTQLLATLLCQCNEPCSDAYSVRNSASKRELSATVIPGSTMACVDCQLVAETPKELTRKHGNKRSKAHGIFLDRKLRELYCTKCDDYVYLDDFDVVMYALKNKDTGQALAPLVTSSSGGPKAAQGEGSVSGGAHQTEDWKSDSGDDEVILSESLDVKSEEFVNVSNKDTWPLGLRGMNNMGNTCFMNSILQAFIRTPKIRDYYLQGRHFKGNCRVSGEGGRCVECELDAVISKVFSGERTPYSPVNFLHTWWMMAGGILSGYKQQDAHEFFLFILQMLTGPSSIATTLFIGQMESHIFCQACGRTSVQNDEFSHLSLDVLPPAGLLPQPIVPKSKAKPIRRAKRSKGSKQAKSGSSQVSVSASQSALQNVSDIPSVRTVSETGVDDIHDTLSSPGRKHLRDEDDQNGAPCQEKVHWNHPSLAGYLHWPGDSLLGCLRRFTTPEILDSRTHSWTCTDCNAKSGAAKQISILRLPPILTLHFKRFEHIGGTQARGRKLETFVAFPLNDLDMSPYLTSRISLDRHRVRKSQGFVSNANFVYDAFAVICHRGTFQGGHYVTYVRCDDNKWYLCDDAFVIEVPEDVVRNCQAYMVLYSLQSISPWRLRHNKNNES
ncbi:hypothetical protein M9434_002010 [Picochlorum sp. BPE23]|nr:hypothetical protein M9434_002010 [Picochlorum sp. BPE23]